jgi:hypothetical protein
MSPSDPDLHRAITLRPSPFHHHPERVSESQDRSQPAQSTAFEQNKDGNNADAVSRPVYTRNSSESEREDVERQSLPNYDAANDPYDLRSGLKSVEEIDTIKANTSRKRKATCVPISQPKAAVRAHKIKNFYESQNERIEKLLRPVDEHVRLAKEEQGADALQFKIAVHASFVANILLAILQVYGAAASASLSLFTTMADSIFDPMRYVIL